MKITERNYILFYISWVTAFLLHSLMFCSKCGALNPGPQCLLCDNASSTLARRDSKPDTTSVLANPKALVLFVVLGLMFVSFVFLHPKSVFIALLCIMFSAVILFQRGIRLTVRLTLIGVAFALVVTLNSIEGWQEARSIKSKEERPKQEILAATEQARKSGEAFRKLTDREHLDQARPLLRVELPQSSVDDGLKHLDAISAQTIEYTEAKRLRRQYDALKKKQDQEQARIQKAKEQREEAATVVENRKLRGAMAQMLENSLLEAGYNVDVRAIGKDHNTLQVKWIFVSKSLAYQLSQQGRIFDNARSVGFKRVEITDGYDETWRWNLD